jgi:hypothetical protein
MMGRRRAVHPTGLHAFVSRGSSAGELLYPHRYEDGSYIVSKTRFERDYIQVLSGDDLIDWLEKGYSLRMSNPQAGISSPSLIKPTAIYRPVVYV